MFLLFTHRLITTDCAASLHCRHRCFLFFFFPRQVVNAKKKIKKKRYINSGTVSLSSRSCSSAPSSLLQTARSSFTFSTWVNILTCSKSRRLVCERPLLGRPLGVFTKSVYRGHKWAVGLLAIWLLVAHLLKRGIFGRRCSATIIHHCTTGWNIFKSCSGHGGLCFVAQLFQNNTYPDLFLHAAQKPWISRLQDFRICWFCRACNYFFSLILRCLCHRLLWSLITPFWITSKEGKSTSTMDNFLY